MTFWRNMSYIRVLLNRLFLMATETSFCELKGKEVINIIDGKRLGKIIDIVFDEKCCRVLGFVVPSQSKSWNIFKSSADIFIPCQDICKIGDDVILVKVFLPNVNVQSTNKSKYAKIATAQETQTQNSLNTENYLGSYDFSAENIEENQNLQNP